MYYDGTLAKTDKSALMHHIEAKCTSPLVHEVVPCDTVLVDGMALIHKLVTYFPQTMGRLANVIGSELVGLEKWHKCG